MRISIAIAGIFLAALAGRAAAAEVPAASRVDAVTVFLSGAEVTRTAQLNLDKGEHTIVFDDLPAEAVPGSIRVDGKATAKLDIESVDTRRRYIARADQATVQAERKSIEDEIEKLRDERGLAQGQQDAAQTQKTLLTNLAELPGRSEEQKGQPVPQTDWTQILGLIATGMTAAQRSALEAEVKKRDLDRKIEDLEKKLSAMAPARVEQTEVKVFVVAAAPLEADLTVRYQVRNAAWVPRYDARLATGSKTAPSRLDLTRRAEIKQRTGESWDNVALQLSTTRPAANAAAPELQTVTVDFEPRRTRARRGPPAADDRLAQPLPHAGSRGGERKAAAPRRSRRSIPERCRRGWALPGVARCRTASRCRQPEAKRAAAGRRRACAHGALCPRSTKAALRRSYPQGIAALRARCLATAPVGMASAGARPARSTSRIRRRRPGARATPSPDSGRDRTIPRRAPTAATSASP
jgi:hypothetical protein